MFSKFLEGLSGGLAQQWTVASLTPAFVFWIIGLLLYINDKGWKQFNIELNSWTSVQQVLALFVGLLCITVSAAIVQTLSRLTLRILEGYHWLPLFWRLGLHCQTDMIRRNRLEYTKLKHKVIQSSADVMKCAVLEWERVHTPDREEWYMPTKLGNILRTAETHPINKYGLDPVIVWTRLWLLLPEDVKQTVAEARLNLNASAVTWLWCLLLSLWWWQFIWMPLVGVGAAVLIYYYWIIPAGVEYGDIIESVFDLYRRNLYEQLQLRRPLDPEQEREVGEALTDYLWTGIYAPILQSLADSTILSPAQTK
ncbi:MAG TPA: hypothetical protein V6C65_39415 [Allocoleopsis sp.]